MKKRMLMITFLVSLFCLQSATAQKRVRDFGIFDRVSVGTFFGTTGAGFELASPVTEYLQLRTGFGVGMSGSYTGEVNYTVSGMKAKTDVEGTVKFGDFRMLLDFYPFPKSSTFHVTGGFMTGKDVFLSAENTKPIVGLNGGLEIGDYLVGFDNKGIAHAQLRVNKFKPYLGLGFGHAVPRRRVCLACDLGVQFWGKPGLYGMANDGSGNYVKLDSRDIDSTDNDEFFDAITKISVFPVLNFRLNVRLF